MRAGVVICAVGGVFLAAQATMLRANPGKQAETERIAQLIRQLGDDDFAKREAASQELDAIGAPALGALRKAAAAANDAEVRQRAESVHRAITRRIQAAAAKVELAKFQGTWVLVSHEGGGQVTRARDDMGTIMFTGNTWVTKNGETVLQSGTFVLVDVTAAPKRFNFTSTVGGNATGFAIFQFDGDSFRYCANDSGAEARPTDFVTKAGDGRYCLAWKRAKK